MTAGWNPKNAPENFGAYDQAKNQWPAGGFDGRGNQLTAMSWTHVYDAESRLKKSTHVNGDVVNYAYDGEGRRVKKTGAQGEVKFVYNAFGRLVAEYGGKASPASTVYLSGDHLGSTRLITNAGGVVLKRFDYAPYGEEIPAGQMGRPAGTEFPVGEYPATMANADGVGPKFTSQMRDAESGLDYFGARYMASAQGRFTSPDGPFEDQHAEDPQSWGLYSYVRNNPLKYVDPTGQRVTVCTGGDFGGGRQRECDSFSDEEYQSMVESGRKFNGATLPALPSSANETAIFRLTCGGSPCGRGEWINDHIGLQMDPAALLPMMESAGVLNSLLGGLSMKEAGTALGRIWADEVGSAMTGGGKTARKINVKRYEEAKERLEGLQRVFKRMDAWTNKTPDQKAAIKRVERAIAKAKADMKASEPHAVAGQGSR